jgi:predicted nucleic acid-binding protein
MKSEYVKSNILDFVNANVKVYIGNDKRDDVMRIAEQIMVTGIKHADAIHVACAIIANCDYCVTTDKRMLKFKSDSIKLINPIDLCLLSEKNYGNN